LSILFYIRNEHLKPLEEYCNSNKLLVSVITYSELEQVGKNVNIDFTPLYNETIHIEVYDPNEKCHTLYLKLLNFFNEYTKDLLYSLDGIDDDDSMYLKNDFYQTLDQEILKDETIKYNMVLLEKLKQYINEQLLSTTNER